MAIWSTAVLTAAAPTWSSPIMCGGATSSRRSAPSTVAPCTARQAWAACGMATPSMYARAPPGWRQVTMACSGGPPTGTRRIQDRSSAIAVITLAHDAGASLTTPPGCRPARTAGAPRAPAHGSRWPLPPVPCDLAGERVGDLVQQGADRGRGEMVQERPLRLGQAVERRLVVAVQRDPGLVLALGREDHIGVQRGEQAARLTGRLPAQPDRPGVVALHRT